MCVCVYDSVLLCGIPLTLISQSLAEATSYHSLMGAVPGTISSLFWGGLPFIALYNRRQPTLNNEQKLSPCYDDTADSDICL